MKISNFQFPISKNRNSGQVVLLTVLMLSAVFLSATAIAGLLTTYQLGQVGRITDTTESILAADAAIERALFAVFRCNSATTPPSSPNSPNPWNDGTTNDDVAIFCPISKNPDTSSAVCPVTAPQNFPPPFCNDASYELNIESFDSGPGNFDPTASITNVSLISAKGYSGKTARSLEIKFLKPGPGQPGGPQ